VEAKGIIKNSDYGSRWYGADLPPQWCIVMHIGCCMDVLQH
jgi:hypothetical protein